MGFGLAGIEQARPRFAGEFRSVFASAIAAGLHSVPHAGEMSGPATIAEALDGLHAERIGHGISCMGDPALVARLRESQIPLKIYDIERERCLTMKVVVLNWTWTSIRLPCLGFFNVAVHAPAPAWAPPPVGCALSIH